MKEGQPIALEWWCRNEIGSDDGMVSEDGLVIVRNTGAITISSSHTFVNLLGENSEFLEGPPTVHLLRVDTRSFVWTFVVKNRLDKTSFRVAVGQHTRIVYLFSPTWKCAVKYG